MRIRIHNNDRKFPDLMTLEEVEYAGPAAVPAGGVQGSLLRPHDKVVHVVLREGQAGRGHRLQQ